MATHSTYNQAMENRRALIESMMTTLNISEAEAEARFEEGDWRGMNSTEAAREYEQKQARLTGSPNNPMSVPYGVEESEEHSDDLQGSLSTVPAPDTSGVTPAQVVVDDEQEPQAEKGAKSNKSK